MLSTRSATGCGIRCAAARSGIVLAVSRSAGVNRQGELHFPWTLKKTSRRISIEPGRTTRKRRIKRLIPSEMDLLDATCQVAADTGKSAREWRGIDGRNIKGGLYRWRPGRSPPPPRKPGAG